MGAPLGERRDFPTGDVSPTIQNILEGKAKIIFLSTGLATRNVEGNEYSGTYYMYKLEVPHPTQKGETWETTITTWSPAAYSKKDHVTLPGMQITIEAFGGEMPLSSNPEVLRKVYDEIGRQVTDLPLGRELMPEHSDSGEGH